MLVIFVLRVSAQLYFCQHINIRFMICAPFKEIYK